MIVYSPWLREEGRVEHEVCVWGPFFFFALCASGAVNMQFLCGSFYVSYTNFHLFVHWILPRRCDEQTPHALCLEHDCLMLCRTWRTCVFSTTPLCGRPLGKWCSLFTGGTAWTLLPWKVTTGPSTFSNCGTMWRWGEVCSKLYTLNLLYVCFLLSLSVFCVCFWGGLLKQKSVSSSSCCKVFPTCSEFYHLQKQYLHSMESYIYKSEIIHDIYIYINA